MRRHSFNKRNWTNNIKSIKTINWSFLIVSLILFQGILIFLVWKNPKSILWITSLIIHSLFFIFVSWKIFFISIFVWWIIFGVNFQINKITNINIDGNYKVVKIFENGIICQKNFQKIYVKTTKPLNVDDLIQLKSIQNKKVDFNSNFDKYLLSLNISNCIIKSQIKLIGHSPSISSIVKNYLNNDFVYYSRYVGLIMFGFKNSKNKPIIDKLKNIGIMHLFSISGFHISLLLTLLFAVFKKIFKIKNKYVLLSIFILIIPYLFIVEQSIAVNRAFIFSFLCFINKNFFSNKFSKLNIISTISCLFISLNPYIIYSTSFVASFGMSFLILFLIEFEKFKNKKTKLIILISIFSLIINCWLNKQINLTSIITNYFFTPIISLSFLVNQLFWWIPKLLDNYYFFIDLLINVANILTININININEQILVLIVEIIFTLLLIFNKKPQIKFNNPNNKNIFLKLRTNFN